MAHRPFTPRQQAQNAAFLDALRRTGNVRLACRELGVHRATYTKRRANSPAFAALWERALAAAHALLKRAGGERLPHAQNPPLPLQGRGTARSAVEGPLEVASDDLRTKGGEPMIVRLSNGRLQLRHAPPGRMTEAAAQRFLATLAETANLRMAATTTGYAHTSFLARRARPAFAHQLEQAREAGRDRVAWLWVESRRVDPDGPNLDADLPIPPMTAEQAILQLVYHRADGRFQRSLWRRRLPPPPLAKVAPRIRVIFEAVHRAERYKRKRRRT